MKTKSNYPEFGGQEIPPEFKKYASAKTVVIPVPYEGTVCYGTGTAKAPLKIIDASRFQEYYDDELEQLTYQCGIATLPALKPAKTPQAMAKVVEEACRKPVQEGKFVVMLGGEHSVSLGLYRALAKRHKKLSIVQIDAHPDIRETYHGSSHSHACVMRRIADSCDSMVHVGIRSVGADEAWYIQKNRKKVFFARDIVGNNRWIQTMLKQLHHDVFLTIDVDGFDPSVFPHTGTPEPGGLSWYQGLELFRALFKHKNVAGMDIVEVASDATSRNSEYTAAKLAYRLIGYKFPQ